MTLSLTLGLMVRMSDAQRNALEAYRARNGHRSLNAALLGLIDHFGDRVEQFAPTQQPKATGRLTMADVRPKFEPRLKKPKGEK